MSPFVVVPSPGSGSISSTVMVKPVKRKVPGGTSGGRTTPSGGTTRLVQSSTGSGALSRPGASTRYTPPAPAAGKLGPSGRWVPITMFSLLGAGVLMIVINYMSVLLPGAPSNWYIIGGLGLILGGIIVATQWR